MRCKHRPRETRGPFPFNGSINSAKENPSAHGWAYEIETCRCGAKRKANFNGPHREVGPWTEDTR